MDCRQTRPAALIYDLHPVGEPTLRRFLSLKRRVQYLPAILYPSPAPGVATLLGVRARMPFVLTELQSGAGDAARLQRGLRFLIANAPFQRFWMFVRRPLSLSTADTQRFARELVRRLRSGASSRDTAVDAVARAVGTTSRTLERHSVGSPLGPRELRDWMMLLLAEYLRGDNSLAKSGKGLGIDPQRLYRIKQRLIRDHEGDASGFAHILAAFDRRCRTIVIR